MDQNELTIAEIESLLFSNPSSNDGRQQQLSAEAFHQLVARRFATELTTFVGANVVVSVEPAQHIVQPRDEGGVPRRIARQAIAEQHAERRRALRGHAAARRRPRRRRGCPH